MQNPGYQTWAIMTSEHSPGFLHFYCPSFAARKRYRLTKQNCSLFWVCFVYLNKDLQYGCVNSFLWRCRTVIGKTRTLIVIPPSRGSDSPH
ncbi:hypothetical protein FKM82_013196 [Ascaphus truei]